MSALEKTHDLRFVQHRGRWYICLPDLTDMLADFALQAQNRGRAQEVGALQGIIHTVHEALAKGKQV